MTTKEAILALVPKKCEHCGSNLILSEDLMHLRCENPQCEGKLYRRIEIMCKAFEIENIGIKTAQEMVVSIPVVSEDHLFRLTPEDLLRVPRFKKGMADKVYNSIQKVKYVSLQQFIRGCQFARVGDGTAARIAEKYKSLDEFLNTTARELNHRTGIGENVSVMVINSIKEKRELVDNLLKYVQPGVGQTAQQKEESCLAVVTGPLHYGSRPEFQKMTKERYGVRWTSSVSRNVNYLVTNETKPTSKYKKAKELQEQGFDVKIVTEEQFLKLFGEESVIDTFLKQQQEDMQAQAGFLDNMFDL